MCVCVCVREREGDRLDKEEVDLEEGNSSGRLSLSYFDPAAAAAKPHKSILIKVRGFGSFSA